ncbi:hypothetical protein Tco_1290878, partial [Tanacetum coccineum]
MFGRLTNTGYSNMDTGNQPLTLIQRIRITDQYGVFSQLNRAYRSSDTAADCIFHILTRVEEEVAEAMGEPTMEEYMTKTRENYGSRIARPKIDDKAHFELKGLDVPTRQILDSKGTIPSMKADDAKKAIQDMADHSQKWHNRMSTRTRSTDPSDGLTVIQAQLNNLGR